MNESSRKRKATTELNETFPKKVIGLGLNDKPSSSKSLDIFEEEDNYPSKTSDSFMDMLSDVEENEDEEILDGFFQNKETVGKKVSDSLAKTIDNAMCTVVGDDKIKELIESVDRPENCKNLIVPKTNERIWKNMTTQQRGHDRKFQKTQQLTVKTTCKLTELLDSIRESKRSGTVIKLQELEKNLKDCIKLSAATYSEINLHRLLNIQTRIPHCYKSLCRVPFSCNNDNEKSTELLLGKDLNQKMKEKDEEEKFKFKQPKNLKSPRPWSSGEPRSDQRAAQSSRGKRQIGFVRKGFNKRKV